MTLPNILTILRIILIPGFVAMYFTSLPGRFTYSVVILLISGITDVLDGYIARKYHLESKLGAVLDPLADKLMQFTVFICLYLSNMIPGWLVALLLIKELTMGVGTFVLLKKKIVVQANASGKIATCVFYITAFFIMLLQPQYLVSSILALIAVLSALYAMASYGVNFFKVMKNEKDQNTI